MIELPFDFSIWFLVGDEKVLEETFVNDIEVHDEENLEKPSDLENKIKCQMIILFNYRGRFRKKHLSSNFKSISRQFRDCFFIIKLCFRYF